jgi:V/A-type H+-transporting ATPase subunit I
MDVDTAVTKDRIRVISVKELEELDTWLGEVWRECSRCEEIQHRIDEDSRELEQLNQALGNYENLDINLDLLHGKIQFLDLQLGMLPAVNVDRLRQAVGLLGYTVSVFTTRHGAAHVVLTGLKGVEQELSVVLETVSFRHIELPPEFRDYPTNIRAQLAKRASKVEQARKQTDEQVHKQHNVYDKKLRMAVETLVLARPYSNLADLSQSHGTLTRLAGWVPADRVDKLKTMLLERLSKRFVLESRKPMNEERSLVPSAMRHPRVLGPFVSLVRNYGIPRYGEFDPSWLFAVSFVLMFGMMFGDVGQGAVIAIVGWLLRNKLKIYTWFAVLAGISSMLFGFVYGSVFTYEELIHPLWMSPLEDPRLMLEIALIWGIAFILLATGLTIHNRLIEGNVKDALFSGTGVSGMLLYLGMIYAGYRLFTTGTPGIMGGIALTAPMLLILGYKWIENTSSYGERIIIVLIEGFETIMSYISNTLSFLRVAAFSLNHVALAIAVFTIAEMMDTTGYWITVVLGNIFILVLEGAIVAIQVLRLEYYEGFSRFFSGSGREFRPLTLDTVNSQRI